MPIFRRRHDHEIDPDEILLDASNIPEFNTQQFEGRIERTIPKTPIYALAFACFALIMGFTWRLVDLQLRQGPAYAAQSEENRLEEEPLFGVRGVLYDRSGVELAWNTDSDAASDFYYRAYRRAPGLAHVVGYVSHPKADARGVYWQKEVSGRDGAERTYDERLKGVTGKKLIEKDATGAVRSEAVTVRPTDGENVHLSIDAKVQEELHRAMSGLARQVGFQGGAGVILDVVTGEIIALTSYPEYDPSTLSRGQDREAIARTVRDPKKPFLNRVVSGLYTPGSTVKPFMAYGALAEGIISPEKQILSTGQISIPNPFVPGEETVFKDWKAHGFVDMRRAIAVSSDVYFYAVGGGYGDQPGLGIDRIDQYMRMFGFAAPSGVNLNGEAAGTIPTPEWKEKNFGGEKWLLGNTYHTSIGQYGFQMTPLQLARAIGAVATGSLVEPHIGLGEPSRAVDLKLDPAHVQVIRDGMRAAVRDGGTAAGLNVAYVAVGGKTGTAELGAAKQFVNSWVTGFFPYEAPRYAFAVVMERGPRGNTIGATFVMRTLLDWMREHAPEYFKAPE